MKSMFLCLIASTAIAFSFIGCTSEKIQVIRNDKVVTNNVPMKAFNDESYIWENWTFGTNRVEKID